MKVTLPLLGTSHSQTDNSHAGSENISKKEKSHAQLNLHDYYVIWNSEKHVW